MATEADTPKPVPLMETVHLTAEEFNQPSEPTDYLMKSVHAHESINLQDRASEGEIFLKSSMEAKVASEDTCRKQEPFQAVKTPHEAEKDLEENEKQINVDENFDSADTLSKEKDAAAEIIYTAQNVGENSEFVDSTEMMKIEDPELEMKETISSEEKINQVEEIVKVNLEIEENTVDYKNGETRKTGDYAEAETSKEVDKPEGIFDQNTGVSAHTNKDAYLEDETENSTVGTDATHIEGSVTEESAAGAEEKQPESCSSYETIKLSEKERSNDSVAADSLCTHNDQIAISESKEVAEDEPDMPSVPPATHSSAIEETDLIVHETEKTTSAACPTESQELIDLSENMKDTSQIADEMQERKAEDSAVTEDTVKEIPEEIGISEAVEKPGKTDRSEATSSAAAEENKVEIKDHEIDLHGSSVQNDELKSEKIEKSRNVSTEGADSTCSVENIEANKCTEEEAVDVNNDDSISNKMDASPTESAEKIEIAEVEISNAAGNEKLAKVEDVDGDEKEFNHNKTNTEETVEKKEDSCDIQMPKLEPSEMPDENRKYYPEKITSEEVINAAFVEENTEQRSQPSNPQEAEPINEDTVNISQGTVEVAEASRKEDDNKKVTEERFKSLSQKSVEECLDKNSQNEQKSADISSREKEETGKPVDISSDTTQNDEISASTLQTYQEKEERSLQIEATPSGPSASETKGKDMDWMTTNRETENNEVLEEVKENKETESEICRLMRSKKHEEDLKNNESEENLQEVTGVVTAETEKDDISKTAEDETVENPQNNVIEEETQKDEKKSENSNIESPETSEKDETSNSTVEACLTNEQEILKDENSNPKEASETPELHGIDSSKVKDEQLENNAVQTEVDEEIQESIEHEENLDYTQKNKPVENQEQANIVEPSETKNHVSDEMIKDLEVETVDKNGSDIKEDNYHAVSEAVDEDVHDKKADTAEAESETIEKDKFDQADNAEVETFEEGIVDKKEDIATVETVTENNLQKVVEDADLEKIEKEAPEVETVEENGLDKNAENAEGEIVETITEEDVAKIEKADSTCNEAKEDTGEQEYLKEQKMNDDNDTAPLECAEPSPIQHFQTDAKNAEDSTDKDIELSMSAEKHENIADDANQKDEIPSTCISTSLAEEAEKSYEECETVPPSQTSPDKKEDVSQIQMVKNNENTAALADTYASVDEEPSKEGDDSNEKTQNEESTNTAPQTSRVEEQDILERDNQAEAEASPAELKDEDQSYIKTDETNDNDVVVLEVEEEKQKEKLKDDEPISIIIEETMDDGSSKTTGELENAKTSDDLGEDSEVSKEESSIPEASEEYNQNSSREILREFETVSSAENIAQEKDQKDESPCATPSSLSVGKEEIPMHEYADATSAEVSTDEHREKDDTPVYSGENNEYNDDKREISEETTKSGESMEQSTEKKLMEGLEETSKYEEKLEEEPPKNQPEELLQQSSNAVNVETDAVTLSERAIVRHLGEVETIKNDEGKIEEGREEKEETGKINADQVEEKFKEQVFNQDASDTVEQPLEESTVKEQPSETADEKMNEEEMIISASKQEVNEIIQTAERDDSTGKQMTAEGNAKEPKTETDKENSEENENENEKECNEAEVKEEVKVPKSEASITTEGTNYEEENKNESNVAELKEEVEEPKSDPVGIIEASGSEEAKGYIISETKLPASCTDSLPEISSSKSEDREEIIEKEEPNRNDISSLSVTEGEKDISLSEPVTDDKVQAESSIPISEESELKLNSEETTLNYVNTEVSEEKGTLEAADQANEDTDKFEKETNSESGVAVKSEASSKEAIETEKLEIEQKEEDIGTKAEVGISNETVQMEERAIIFEEAISKEENSTTKAEVSSKENAAMYGETIEPEVPISAEAHSVKEVEEESSKEAMEVDKFTTQPETAVLEGPLTTKPVASSKEAIEGDDKETKPEEVISKEEYSAKNNESLKEVKAGKVTVEPEIATSAAENPIATVVKSSETAIEVEKEENEPDSAAIKKEDSATKAEVALNKDVEAEKEETQHEVAISQEVDLKTEVEESFDATITKDEDSTKNAEVSSKEVEAEKFAVEPEIATYEAEYPVEKDEVRSEVVEAAKDQPEVVVSEEVNPVSEVVDIYEVEKTESEPEAAAAFKERHSATKAEATLHQDVEAAKDQPEVIISEEVDPVTEDEDICEVAISEREDLATKVKESSEVTNTIQPEVVVAQEVDSMTKIEASSEADTSVGGNLAIKVEASSKVDIKEEKVETRSEVVVSEGEDLATKVAASSDAAIQEEKAKIEPEADIPTEKDPATDEAASEEDTAVQKSTTQPEVAILEEVDSLTKVEIEQEGPINEERNSAAELKAVSEDDVVVEKSTSEPELTISEEAGSVLKVGGITKEAEREKVDIEPRVAIFDKTNAGAKFKVAEFDETEKSTTEPAASIYEEVDSTTTVRQSKQEADEVEKQVTEPQADISRKKDSTTAFEAASENIEAHKSTTPEVAIHEEVDPAIMVGGSTKEAYEVEKQHTEPEAEISKEEDSATKLEAESEDVEGYRPTTAPELAISEEVNSVAKVGGSTSKADEVEKQETELEVISKEKDSATEFEVALEGDEEVQKSTTEAGAAISEEVDSVKTVGGCQKEADEVQKHEIEPEATTSKENNSASEFKSASEDVKAQKSTTEPEEAIISQEKDSTAEFEVAKEEDAEVQKSTTEPALAVSEKVYSVKNVGESTKEADKVEKQDVKPKAAMSTEKDSVAECDAASEEDAELQKLTILTEEAISEEVNSVTKVEKSINEAHEGEKSDTCGKKDSEAEESLTKVDEVAKADICEDTKVEANINEADEVEKVAAELVATICKAEGSDAKVEMTNDNAEEEKEADEPAAAIQRDLVTEAELSKEAVEVEKETTKVEEAIFEDRSVDAAEDEKAPMELDRSVPEDESNANKIHETQMDMNIESNEPGKKTNCSSEIGASNEGDEIVSETTQIETENRNDALDHSSESNAKSLREYQDIQLDIQEKVNATDEEEAPKTDDTIDVATLSTEVHGDAEINDSKALHTVSVQEERINDVNVPCLESIGSVNAAESDGNEVQKIAETSLEEAQASDKQVQVPSIPSNSCPQRTEEIEGSERNVAVETVESQVLSSDLASEASKVVNDENEVEVKPQDENADTVEESRKESETVAESKHEELYTAETEVKIEATVEETTGKEHGTAGKSEVDETKESKQDSGEIGEKTEEVSKETLVFQDESTVMENNTAVVTKIPEEVKKENFETQETTEIAEKETPENVEVADSKTDSDIIEEFQKQELCSAETGEADDITKSIFNNKTEEAVIEKEIIVLQESSKEETKEQQERASPVLPSKEEACETKAAEEMEQNKTEILSKADETPEKSSEQETTEEGNLQQEEPKVIEVSTLEPEIKSGEVYTNYKESEKKEQSLREIKDEIKQSFIDVEPATEVIASGDQTLTEKASEAQNKLLPQELVLEEQVHGTWTVLEKKEKSIDETEVLKHITKETEESFFDKEEQKKPEVSSKEATETQVGIAIDEDLPVKTAVSDKILDCETETCEETVTFGLESRSHGGLVGSEAKTDPKIPEAATTQSITEENLRMQTFEETESIPNKENKEQIEMEKEGAKDCPSISHGEETTNDRHVEFKLKAEDSIVNEKEKNIEKMHEEEEEIDARKTIVDQLDDEEGTVEQPQQAVAEDAMEKIIQQGTRELKPQIEEVKSKEVPAAITGGTNQEEFFNATPENQITREAEPGKPTEMTTTDGCVETTEKIKEIAESTESGKISLLDMMQRSTREKQAVTQECQPKDEVNAGTEERKKSDEAKDDGETDEEHKKNDSGSDDPVMLEASKDTDVKVPHKKSHNILSGVGSKVKHSISKVKKAITGKSSHSKQNSPKSGTKEQVNPGY